MCPHIVMSIEKHKNNLLFRIAGLLGVGLIGSLLMGCGLALAFGNHRLSMILFGLVVVLLVIVKVVVRSKD